MTTPLLTKLRSRAVIYGLIAVAAILVLMIAYSLGARSRESARMAGAMYAMGPGAGAPGYEEAPYRAAMTYPKMAGGARGGRAGGRGSARYGMAAPRAAGGPAPQESEALPSWGSAAYAATITPVPSSLMVIYTGSLQVRVQDVPKAHEEVARIARAAGGYVSDSSLSAESGPTAASITIRIPAQSLDDVTARISALGKLLSKQLNAQEVTEEYTDLSSRRRNLEREELRLLELLQRAGKVRDLLEVEETIARVRGEIEQIAGRLRYLENRVALSTLRIDLQGPERLPTAGGPVWAASDVARTALRSLLDTGRGLASMGIWLGIYAIIWVPLLLLALWLIRKALRAASTPAA
jgi:hypothetical protein